MSLTFLLSSFTHSREKMKRHPISLRKKQQNLFPLLYFSTLPVSSCVTSGITSWLFKNWLLIFYNGQTKVQRQQMITEVSVLPPKKNKKKKRPKIIILKRQELEYISSHRIKAKYHLFQCGIFTPHSSILLFFRTIPSQYFPFQFLSGSQQSFFPTF